MNQLLRSLSACSVLLGVAQAQQIMTFAGNTQRMSSRLAVFSSDGKNFSAVGQACIDYEPPAWKDEYDAMADQAKGKTLRLGKNFWTTLDNNLDMMIGETKVPAGQWYLGLACSEKGDWSLMVMNAAAVRDRRMDAFQTGQVSAKINAPLTYAKSDKKLDKLTIELQKADKQDGAGTLMIAWGNHRLTAPIKLDLESAKKAPGKKGEEEEDEEHEKGGEKKKVEPKKGEPKKGDKQEEEPRDSYEYAVAGTPPRGYFGGSYRF